MLKNEILIIILQNIYFLSLFVFPKIIPNKKINFSFFDQISINIIIILNILLFFSFFSISYYILFISTLLFSVTFLFLNFEYYKNHLLSINFIIFFLLSLVLSLDIAYELIFDWDTKSFWYQKTLNFYQNQSINNLSNLPVADWPHLSSFVWSFFWKFPFDSYEYLGRLFFSFFYLVSIFSISEILNKNLSVRTSLSIILVLLTYKYDFFSGEADIFIFSVLIFITKIFYLLFNEKKMEIKLFLLILILFSVNLLLWIKLEGIVYASIFIFISLFFKNITLKHKLFMVNFFLIMVIAKFYLINYLGLNINSKWFEFNQTLNFDIEVLSNKILILLKYFLYYSFNLPIYLLLFVSLIIFYSKAKILTDYERFLFYSIFLNILFLITAFLFKTDDIEWQIKSSLKMFMLNSSGMYISMIILSLNRINVLIKK